MNEKSIAIVVDTPYQIMSAVSLTTNHISKEIDIDIYVDTKRCVNVDMDILFKRLKKSGLFKNVVGLRSLTSGRIGIRKNLSNYFEWLFPKLSIKIGIENGASLNGKKYDTVVVSGPFMLQRNFLAFFPKARIVFIEDGSGSYTGRIGVANLGKKGALMQKLLRRGPLYIYPSETYLYSPMYYRGEYLDRIKRLKIANQDVLNSIFESKSRLYSDFKVVYFDQPKYAGEKESIIDDKVLDLLNNGKRIIVRPHPQLKDRDYKHLFVDDECLQWEMICSKYIDEQSTLIGKYSTAQLTPKLLFNKEPTIILTHRLYDNPNNNVIDDAVERIKAMYMHKERVVIVESIKQLEIAIRELE